MSTLHYIFNISGNIAVLSGDNYVVNEEIYIGDWCIFSEGVCENLSGEDSLEDPKRLIGMVLGFSYLTGKTFKDREFSKSFAPVTSDVSKGIGMLCTVYTYNVVGVLSSVPGDKHKYARIESYIATIKHPSYTNKVLTISSKLLSELDMITSQTRAKSQEQP